MDKQGIMQIQIPHGFCTHRYEQNQANLIFVLGTEREKWRVSNNLLKGRSSEKGSLEV